MAALSPTSPSRLALAALLVLATSSFSEARSVLALPLLSLPLPPSPSSRTAIHRSRRSGSPSASLSQPPPEQQGIAHQLSLPPASERNVVAEILAAAEIATRQAGKTTADRPWPEVSSSSSQKPLRLVSAVVSGTYQQLVAQEIDQISTGKHKGKSWLRPLAMRTCQNATLAADAFRYDPALGWFAAETEAGGVSGKEICAHVHVFSPLVAAVFLPTELACEVDASLALAVRMLCDAHAAQVNLEEETSHSGDLFVMPGADVAQLRPFLFAVCAQGDL